MSQNMNNHKDWVTALEMLKGAYAQSRLTPTIAISGSLFNGAINMVLVLCPVNLLLSRVF